MNNCFIIEDDIPAVQEMQINLTKAFDCQIRQQLQFLAFQRLGARINREVKIAVKMSPVTR
jgi:hypothetical protein